MYNVDKIIRMRNIKEKAREKGCSCCYIYRKKNNRKTDKEISHGEQSDQEFMENNYEKTTIKV